MIKLGEIKKKISNNLINIPGWSTNRKLIIIESDDWGSIRMPSNEVYFSLLKKGYPVDKNLFNMLDTLESNDDVELLLEVLSKFKDKNGNSVILTMNNIVANPNFKKIKENDFQNYFYEPFTDTLKRYPNHDRVFKLLKEGVSHKLLRPQYHGREHLNVARWMYDLKNGNEPLNLAFDYELYSMHSAVNPEYFNQYMDSLDFDCFMQLEAHEKILEEGYQIFSGMWGFDSKSFVANCYTWHSRHEQILNKLGVRYLQGVAIQFVPIENTRTRYRKVIHYTGQRNSVGQRYLVRNAFFEPYQNKYQYDVTECLRRINIAFIWNKPAIISTHRINFVGSLDEEHRDKNLKLFTGLLKSIIKKWPSVEFMSSDELGDIILADY